MVNDRDRTHDDSTVPAFEQVVLRHSADAALLLHPTDGVVYASPAVAHVIGIGPNEWFGMRAADWVHPDDVEHAIGHRRIAASAGHSGPALIRGRHGDGTYHWFEAEWWHLATDHTVLHLRDAQRQRTAIEAMRDELTRTTALLEHSREITFAIHPTDDRVLHAGPAARRLLGMPASGSLPSHWREIVDPTDHATFSLLLLEARESGTEAVATVGLTDGTTTWPVIVRVHDLTADPRVAAVAVFGLRHSG